jgi:hypothetical protein
VDSTSRAFKQVLVVVGSDPVPQALQLFGPEFNLRAPLLIQSPERVAGMARPEDVVWS